jgi:hypothetical protein
LTQEALLVFLDFIRRQSIDLMKRADLGKFHSNFSLLFFIKHCPATSFPNKKPSLLFSDTIHQAETLLQNPDASIAQLQRATELLTTAQPRLSELERQYDDLDPDDPAVQALRNKTAAQLAKLNELFTANQQSASDRIENIVARQHDLLAHLITEAQQSLANPKALPEDFTRHSDQLEHAIGNVQAVMYEAPADALLERILDLAANARKSLDEKSDLWRRFKALRDEIGDDQEQVQKWYDGVKGKGLRPVDGVQSEIKGVKVGLCFGGKRLGVLAAG